MHSQKVEMMRAEKGLCEWLPATALLYTAVAAPTLFMIFPSAEDASRLENRLTWPILTALALLIIFDRREKLADVRYNILCLCAFLLFCALSTFWALFPGITLFRVVTQAMIVLVVVGPALLNERDPLDSDLLFYSVALIVIANLMSVLWVQPSAIGFQGIYTHKNSLGHMMAYPVLFGLFKLSAPGLTRRIMGAAVALGALWLLAISQSKTSLALAAASPTLAGLIIALALLLNVGIMSVAYYLTALAVVICLILDVTPADVSTLLFGDPTFTGRTNIWEFVWEMIRAKPFLGWGYQSFWQVGDEGPAVRFGPGWVAQMPNAHNGFLEIVLQTGIIGASIFFAFVLATAHRANVNRFAVRELWFHMTLMLFVVLYNLLESGWGFGTSFSWLVFLMLAAKVGRSPKAVSTPS
jgi:O-antigen ligase